MATDATGTPTSPDGIPTYLTSADAPSGKGFNAAMTSVQSIITQLKAGTLPSGKISPAGLTGYPADVTKVLKGDGTWAAPTAFYRKNTTTTIASTVTFADLLGGGLTTTLGSSGAIRLTAYGLFSQNTGAPQGAPIFGLRIGGTLVVATGTFGNVGTSVSNGTWRAVFEIVAQSAAAQVISCNIDVAAPASFVANAVNFSTGSGIYQSVMATGATPFQAKASGIGTGAVNTSGATLIELLGAPTFTSASYSIACFAAFAEVL